MKQLLREPLFLFLLIGAALFVPYYWLQPDRNINPDSTEIRLSFEDISQQVLLFQAQWGRDPAPEELRQLMENRVRQEVLYREGLALGLDKEDAIIQRRIAQKMQFLAEDVANARNPTPAELREWYQQNANQFALPARYSFRHLYFSPDTRGMAVRDDALRAAARLADQPEDTEVARGLADPFMFQDYYRERSPEFLSREFGPEFALAIEQLSPGSWQGPVESGLGWHLVFVDEVVPGRKPAVEEVLPEVQNAWMAEQKALAWENAYQAMRERYTVFLPAPPDENTASEANDSLPEDAQAQ